MHIRTLSPTFRTVFLAGLAGISTVFVSGCNDSSHTAPRTSETYPERMNPEVVDEKSPPPPHSMSPIPPTDQPVPIEPASHSVNPKPESVAPADPAPPTSEATAPALDTAAVPHQSPASEAAVAAAAPATEPVVRRPQPPFEPPLKSDVPNPAATVADPAPATVPAPPPEVILKSEPPLAKVYVCQTDSVVSPRAGRCPACRLPMEQAWVANPDLTVCPVTGKKIEHAYYGIVERQPYAFCSPNCVMFMLKDPQGYLEAAEQRRDAVRSGL